MTKYIIQCMLLASVSLTSPAWSMYQEPESDSLPRGNFLQTPVLAAPSSSNSEQDLFKYTQKGDLNQLQRLCPSREVANILDSKGRSLLEHASYFGHTALVRWLLDQGANARYCDQQGSTALHMAVQERRTDIVEILAPLSSVDHKDDRNLTPLHVAVLKQNEPIVRLLCRQPMDINLPASEGRTALGYAAQRGNREIVSLLLENGASAHISDQYEISPLSEAAFGGHIGVVDVLLRVGRADPNVPRDNGVTPLVVAAFKGLLPVVKRLVEGGADLMYRVPNTQGSALQYAQYAGHEEVVAFLEEKVALLHAAQQKQILKAQDQQIAELREQLTQLLQQQQKDLDTERKIREQLEERLQKILNEHEAAEKEAKAMQALIIDPDLSIFYGGFKRKLTSLFLAYQVLDTGLVTRQQGAAVSFATKGIDLLGSIIPLPGVGMVTDVINAGINYWDDKRAAKKASTVLALFNSLVALDEEVERSARFITTRYEHQIKALDQDSITRLVDCGVARFVAHMGSKNFDVADQLAIQCRKALDLTCSFPDTWPFGRTSLKTKDGMAWHDLGVFQYPGIRTADGKKFTPQGTFPNQYGYKLVTLEELDELGLEEDLLSPSSTTSSATSSSLATSGSTSSSSTLSSLSQVSTLSSGSTSSRKTAASSIVAAGSAAAGFFK